MPSRSGEGMASEVAAAHTIRGASHGKHTLKNLGAYFNPNSQAPNFVFFSEFLSPFPSSHPDFS